jgi:organic hydroperoxide reductase OsmC/OhrA
MNFPMQFTASAVADSKIENNWSIRAGNFESECAVPREFSGGGGAFSPEDLFALALLNCFIGTFKVYAKNSKVDFSKIEGSASATLDKGESKTPIMKSLKLKIKIYGTDQKERAEALCRKAMQSGFLLNSVLTARELEIEFL